MRKIVLAAVAVFSVASGVKAQGVSAFPPASNVPALAPGALTVPLSFSQPPASLVATSEAAPAGPAPSFCADCALPTLAEAAPDPRPSPFWGGGEGLRWDLGVGYEYVRFNSYAFDSNLNGLHTSLTYFPNDWFGIEGSVVAAFGTKQFDNETSRYLLYTIGPKIAWRTRKWGPWVHVLVGGMHMIPQIAGQGQNGFAVQAGGGVDYRITVNLSARFDGDYVRSQLYSSGQNNFQFGAGFVIHF
ncbi:MAG TPA: outer membrane beta-barrel protein [Terriglobales bacterium]|nr:outer membrane beta-barrel protein [Terriglobales bacterium]